MVTAEAAEEDLEADLEDVVAGTEVEEEDFQEVEDEVSFTSPRSFNWSRQTSACLRARVISTTVADRRVMRWRR